MSGFLRTTPLPFCIVLMLAACASNQPAPVVDLSMPSNGPSTSSAPSTPKPDNYRVVRGDTLYAIAFKHGLDYRDLAAWNGIASPYTIFAGQELRLSAPTRKEIAVAAPATVMAEPAAPMPEPAPGAAVTAGVADHPAALTAAPAFEDVPPQAEAPASSKAPELPEPATAQAATPTNRPPKPVEAPPKPQSPPTNTAAAAPPPKPIAPPAQEPAHSESTPELSSGGVTWRWPSDGKVIGLYVSGEPTKQGIDIGGKSGDPVRAAANGEVVYSGNGLIGYGELIIVKHNANFLSAYGHNRSRLVKEGDKVKGGQVIAEMGASAGSRDELHFEIRKNGKPVNPLEYLPAR